MYDLTLYDMLLEKFDSDFECDLVSSGIKRVNTGDSYHYESFFDIRYCKGLNPLLLNVERALESVEIDTGYQPPEHYAKDACKFRRFDSQNNTLEVVVVRVLGGSPSMYDNQHKEKPNHKDVTPPEISSWWKG